MNNNIILKNKKKLKFNAFLCRQTKAASYGFTFIELLTVIFILSLLGGFVLISTSRARSKGRDVKKINDIIQLQVALDDYWNLEGVYPGQLIPGEPLTGDLSSLVFLNEVPEDILYLSLKDDYYEMEFNLENNLNEINKGTNFATPSGITSNYNTPFESDYFLEFDGLDDRLVSSKNIDFNINAGDYSASAWVYIDNQDILNWQTIIGVGTSYTQGFHLYANRLCTYGDSLAECIMFTNYLSRNQWYLATVVHNSSENKLLAYLDGVKIMEVIYNINLIDASNQPITSGYRGSDIHYFKGYIYDARIYSRALSDEEISDLYDGVNISSKDLLIRWFMNDGSDCSVLDYSTNKNNALLLPDCPTSSPAWVNSFL